MKHHQLSDQYSVNSLFVWLIITLIAVTEMATDLFAPSLPMIAVYFAESAANTQLTMSAYLIGLGVSGLLFGPISDQYGRRPVLLSGFALFTLAAAMCFFVSSLEQLIIARLIQGIGAGVALPIGIAMINDSFPSNKTANIMSKLGMIVSISPGIAPLIGGYIAHWFGWRDIFLVLCLVSTVVWYIAQKKIPETLSRNHSVYDKFNLRTVLKGYLALVSNAYFMLFALIHSLTFGFIFSESVTLPFLYIEEYAVSQQHFGYYMSCIIAVYIVGALINQKAILSISLNKMIFIGLALHMTASFLLTVLAMTAFASPYSIQLLKIPGTIGLAFIFSNVMPKALEMSGANSGSATALICFLQMMIAAFVTYLVTLFYDHSPLSLYAIAFISAFFCLLAFQVSHVKKKEMLLPQE